MKKNPRFLALCRFYVKGRHPWPSATFQARTCFPPGREHQPRLFSTQMGSVCQAVEFLVHAGVDPDYRPIAASDNSPRTKECYFLLEGGQSCGD